MPFYIKKTVSPVEARQLTESNTKEMIEWCSGSEGPDGSIYLKTPESHGETQIASVGDFIIKGFTEDLGWHFWPVKPSYFNEHYQHVGE
jgi:hypothetical protein